MIIAHDLGTTGDKATLVTHDGAVAASVSVAYGLDLGAGGSAEQSPLDWWSAFATANRRLLERAEIPAGEVSAVVFSGQMMGVVALDAHGELVRPAIIWADTRATAQAARLVQRIGLRRAYGITGHRLNATYSLPKMMWLRDREPDAFARTRVFLQAKDYLVHRLTGQQLTDPSDASGTDAFDQASGDWSGEILAAAEIDRGLLPEILPSTTIVGSVRAEAAAETGLLAGTPVVLGGGDGPMAALGAGIVDEGSGGYAYLGSSSWVSIAAGAPLHDEAMRTMTFNHVVPGRFVPTATMQTGGASLQWITDVLSPARTDRYDELLSAAAAATAAADGLFFLPHLLGERSPYWNPRARAAFVGLQLHHGRGSLVRAVLEGIAFNLRTGLTAFAANGRPLTAIDAIGGAANSTLLLQVLTDVWGVPVTARDLVDEANSIGAAVVGGVAVGVFEDFAVAAGFSRRTENRRPAADDALDGRYEQFLDAYRRLEPWFDAAAD